MDGMIVQGGETIVLSQDRQYSASGSINLVSPTATVAEISVSGFQWLYGSDMVAYGSFTGCVTDGSNPGLPAVETLNDPYGQAVVIRNGLESISWEVAVENCFAYFTVNLFFWPSVNRGTL